MTKNDALAYITIIGAYHVSNPVDAVSMKRKEDLAHGIMDEYNNSVKGKNLPYISTKEFNKYYKEEY